METRTYNFEIREANEGDRTVTGIAVPWKTPAVVADEHGNTYREQFERGAIAGFEGVKFFWNHAEVIGKLVAGRETDEGYEVTARFSDTTHGRDAYVLATDGVVDRFSVGFIRGEHRTEKDGVVTRTKVDLKEVSLVPFPAYAGAQISEVRAELNNANENNQKEVVSTDTTNTNMSEATQYDDSEIRSRMDSFERGLAVAMENGAAPAVVGSQFRSAGNIIHAVANGDSDAVAEFRAYTTGGGLADSQVRPGWYDQGLKYVNANRIGYNLFRHVPLQAEGMSFVVPTFAGSTIQVAKQTEEGAQLAYGKLTTSNLTVNVDTYGGYIEWSKQVKDRSSIDYVNAAVDLLQIEYARKTNAAVVSAVLGASGVNTGTGLTLSSSTVAGWTGFVDEGVAAIGDNTGLLPDFMWVSRDVFYKVKGFADTTGRPLMEVNNDGSNTIGSANAVAVSGRFQGVNLVVDPALPAKTAVMGNSSAVTVFESAGAPWTLTDQDITRLTEQLSLYGYLAVGVLNPKALFKVAVA